ncbi:hypothetical protein SKAU_G00212050 [Synaphobranchus kaupii]|uniref:Uncharacterized protein n=1 Tax=Synaphobranchus kaupii TaxID=118154 RepID=A0A9Q1F9I8_SYNKA|nr:hypothetical protein SKAU_G00212050 [Synaphobranchus kaupii]
MSRIQVSFSVEAISKNSCCGVWLFTLNKRHARLRTALMVQAKCRQLMRQRNQPTLLKQCEHKPFSLGPPSKSGEDLYANLMVARKRKEREERGETEAGGQNQTKTQSQAADDTLHYASVKFIKCKSNPEAAVTNPVYDNASCDTNRKDCSSNEFDPSPAGAATE